MPYWFNKGTKVPTFTTDHSIEERPIKADFILKVPGVYSHSMETIYLSIVHTGS